MSKREVEFVLDAGAQLGEGPLWDYRRNILYWVDITSGVIHIYEPSSETKRFINIGQEVGCIGLRKAGGLVIAARDGFASVDTETGAISNIAANPENQNSATRFNDGKCDHQGRFWAGTLSTEGKPGRGRLYCLYPDSSIRTMLTGVSISNGITWSCDHTIMYYIDTPTRQVVSFDFDSSTGELARNSSSTIDIPPEMGLPDGMTTDADGMLWIALFGGGVITRWNPKTCTLMESIQVPAPRVTSCCFGGTRMDELYITSSRRGLDEKTLKLYPLSGSLFRLRPGICGMPEPMFAG